MSKLLIDSEIATQLSLHSYMDFIEIRYNYIFFSLDKYFFKVKYN